MGVTLHKIEISEKTNDLRTNNNNPNINNIQICDNIAKGEETNGHHGIFVIYCTSHQHGWSFHKQIFGDKLQIWDDTVRLGYLYFYVSVDLFTVGHLNIWTVSKGLFVVWRFTENKSVLQFSTMLLQFCPQSCLEQRYTQNILNLKAVRLSLSNEWKRNFFFNFETRLCITFTFGAMRYEWNEV